MTICFDLSQQNHAPSPTRRGRIAWLGVVGVVIVLSVVGASPSSASDANIVTCALAREGDEFKGTCGIPCSVNALAIDIDGPNAAKACNAPPRQVNASLRQVRGEDWLGRMEGKEPEDPTRFELTKAKPGQAQGVAKLPYGWFALTSAQLSGDKLALSINAQRQLPPDQDDIRIIQRALALLASNQVWNKEDNRQCPPNPVKWSLFCALTQATTEVSGGVHYRQPAMQMAREVLNEVGGNRVKLHRIMDYNNHPETTLDDIHSLLKTAQARLEKRFR